MDATYATVAGGRGDTASGYASGVVGGNGNVAAGGYSAVGGGNSNVAAALGSTVPGGVSNRAGGAYSLAAGRQAKANTQGAFVWADSTAKDFPATGDALVSPAANQFAARATGGAVFVSPVNASTRAPPAGVKLAP